nr:hypothetical protein [Glycine max]
MRPHSLRWFLSLVHNASPFFFVSLRSVRFGEGEATSVQRYGGRRRHTRYAFALGVRSGVPQVVQIKLIRNLLIVRSDTYTSSRERTSFVLIGCERSVEYRCREKEFVRRDTGTRKCGCPFKLRGKPVDGGQAWMVKLICGIHNHELAKSLVRHSYVGRLSKAEKTLITDMTKSMVNTKKHSADSKRA